MHLAISSIPSDPSGAEQPVISVRGLSKSYRLPRSSAHFQALEDVSFEVHPGEVLGIIGRNGSGKSTLLKILSRITTPSGGEALLRGRVASLLEVGTGFHPDLSGRENIYLNGGILGMKRRRIDERFDEIVEFANVGEFIDVPVKRYSSGMYMRLAFAIAAHLDSEILVVDEVLAVGDSTFQKKCLGKMDSISRSGRTVLFVSHTMSTVQALCDRVLWLDAGKIRHQGKAAETVALYLLKQQTELVTHIDLSTRPGLEERAAYLAEVVVNGGNPVLQGAPFTVDLEIVLRHDLDGIALECGFSYLEGFRILSADSDHEDRREKLSRGRHSIRVILPELQLAPDSYLLDVGIRSGVNTSLDNMAGCARVDVLPGPKTAASMLRRYSGLRAAALWTIDSGSFERPHLCEGTGTSDIARLELKS